MLIVMLVALTFGFHRLYTFNDDFLAMQCAKKLPSKKLCGSSYGGPAKHPD
jgi:hypothetical protein